MHFSIYLCLTFPINYHISISGFIIFQYILKSYKIKAIVLQKKKKNDIRKENRKEEILLKPFLSTQYTYIKL